MLHQHENFPSERLFSNPQTNSLELKIDELTNQTQFWKRTPWLDFFENATQFFCDKMDDFKKNKAIQEKLKPLNILIINAPHKAKTCFSKFPQAKAARVRGILFNYLEKFIFLKIEIMLTAQISVKQEIFSMLEQLCIYEDRRNGDNDIIYNPYFGTVNQMLTYLNKLFPVFEKSKKILNSKSISELVEINQKILSLLLKYGDAEIIKQIINDHISSHIFPITFQIFFNIPFPQNKVLEKEVIHLWGICSDYPQNEQDFNLRHKDQMKEIKDMNGLILQLSIEGMQIRPPSQYFVETSMTLGESGSSHYKLSEIPDSEMSTFKRNCSIGRELYANRAQYFLLKFEIMIVSSIGLVPPLIKIIEDYIQDYTQVDTITRLDFEKNKLSDQGIMGLFLSLQVINTSLITTLNLGWNNLKDEGVQRLIQSIENYTALTKLNLEHNHIGDVGAQALAEMLKTNTTLTHLELSGNKIGHQGRSAIRDINIYLTRNREHRKTLKTRLETPSSNYSPQLG